MYLYFARLRLVLLSVLAIAYANAASHPSPNDVVDLGRMSVVADGTPTSFHVIGAAWMRKFDQISKQSVGMQGGGRFYLADKSPTNFTWEPGMRGIVCRCSRCMVERTHALTCFMPS